MGPKSEISNVKMQRILEEQYNPIVKVQSMKIDQSPCDQSMHIRYPHRAISTGTHKHKRSLKVMVYRLKSEQLESVSSHGLNQNVLRRIRLSKSSKEASRIKSEHNEEMAFSVGAQDDDRVNQINRLKRPFYHTSVASDFNSCSQKRQKTGINEQLTGQ